MSPATSESDVGSFLGPQGGVFQAVEEWAGLGQLKDYLSFLEYLLWVFTPLAIVFIVPFLIVILLYLSILFLHVYKVCTFYFKLNDKIQKVLIIWNFILLTGLSKHKVFKYLMETIIIIIMQ